MKNLNYTKCVLLQIFQTLFIRFILIKFRIVQRYLTFGIFPNAERIKFIINLIIFSSLHENIMKKKVFTFLLYDFLSSHECYGCFFLPNFLFRFRFPIQKIQYSLWNVHKNILVDEDNIKMSDFCENCNFLFIGTLCIL